MVTTLTYGSSEWWLDRLGRRLDARRADMERYNDYYHGHQPLRYASDSFRRAFGGMFAAFADNFCGVVVDCLLERVSVQGFRYAEDQPADDVAWQIWQDNDLDAEMAKGFRQAFVCSETAAIVWTADAEDVAEGRKVSIQLQDPLQVVVERDAGDPRDRRAALKRWQDPDSGRLFATLYLPDRIEKWETRQEVDLHQLGSWSGSQIVWQPRAIPGELWPIPNPLGVVPVVPIVNKPDLAGNGESELLSVVPIQDAINKTLLDMLIASEYGAYRQRYVIGLDIDEDPDTGKPIEPFKAAVDRLWTAPGSEQGEQAVQFGEFAQTDLTYYIKAAEALIQHLATTTRMPPHYFLGQSGNIPSGETLKSAEAGLTRKARDRQRDLKDPLTEMMRLAFLLSGDPARARVRNAEVIWSDPETRTESQHMDALMKLAALGVPEEVVWEKIPASPQEIKRWKRLKAAKELLTPPGIDINALGRLRASLGQPAMAGGVPQADISGAAVAPAIPVANAPRGKP